MRRARLCALAGDFGAALAAADQLVELDPHVGAAYGVRGTVHKQRGALAEALSDFDHAIELGPSDAVTFQYRAQVKAELDQHRAAVADYTEAIRLDPNRAELYVERAQIQVSQGLLDDALADATRALDLDPENHDALRLRGVIYEAQDANAEALADYGDVIRLGDRTADAFRNRGDVHLKLGSLQEALEDYTQAIEVDRSYLPAYLGRGRACALLGDDGRALRDFETAIAIDSNNPDALTGRADVLQGQGELERAIDEYRRALKKDNTHRDALFGLIWALVQLGDESVDPWLIEQRYASYEEAIDKSEHAMEVLQGDLRPACYHALALIRLEAYDTAVQVTSNALSQPSEGDQTTTAFLEHMRGEALRLWGDELEVESRLRESLEAFEHAHRLHEAYPNLDVVLAWGEALASLKLFEPALARFDEAVAAAPERGWAHIGRGRALYGIGDDQNACRAFRKALTTEDADRSHELYAHVGTGMALERQGRKTEATRSYRKALKRGGTAHAYVVRGAKFAYYGLWQRELRDLLKAVEKEPDSDEALHALAQARLERSNDREELEEALTMVDQAIELDPEDPELHHTLDTAGGLCLKLGRIDDANNRLERAVELCAFPLVIRARLAEAEKALATRLPGHEAREDHVEGKDHHA